MIRATSGGVEIDVRVIPRARKTEISGVRGDAVLIRLAAPPLDGAANDALVAVLAKHLGVSRRAVRIVAGDHARHKRLLVEGVTEATVRTKLAL